MEEKQRNNPLHGITLKAILDYLVMRCGWEVMARNVNIRCFTDNPSIQSSLKFLRKTPWARKKVEDMYLAVVKSRVPPVVFLVFFLFFTSACEPEASNAQIYKMCDHLLVLRKAEGDKDMKQQCVDEALSEKISQRQALCRISAANKLEYWNRCRTGEAR